MLGRIALSASVLSACTLLSAQTGQTKAQVDEHAKPQSSALSSNQVVVTNSDVVSMVKAGLAPEIVAAKVKNSTCKCDTSPAALAELKASGVPDNVIIAVVQAVSPPPNKPSGLASIRDAKTVYLVNQSTDAKVFDQLPKKLSDWGHWKIVDSQGKADLLLVLSMNSAYVGSINTASASGTATYSSGFGTSIALVNGYFFLTAVDRESQRQLMTVSTIRHTISGQSVNALVNQIKKQVEGQE